MKAFIFLVILITGSSSAFEREEFLAHCGTTYIARSYFPRTLKCVTCKNVKISEADTESFKDEYLNILSHECIVFKDSALGTVNGDFFKQFPNAKFMILSGVDLDLKPSENILENPKLEYLEIQLSGIKDNNHTNAFHSLKYLKSFQLVSCNLENSTIDGELLKMNPELRELKLNLDMPSTNIITDDAFDNLINLKRMSISVFNMTHLSETFFRDKQDLAFVELIGPFDNFPSGLPTSVESLVMQFSEFTSLTFENLRNFKKLTRLSLTQGSLEVIELNAFDGLENLMDLDLRLNEIRYFTERHLKSNWRIMKVLLGNNPLSTRDLILGHQLEEYSKGCFYNY